MPIRNLQRIAIRLSARCINECRTTRFLLRWKFVVLICFSWAVVASGQEWPQWRGPTGDNHAAGDATGPTKWSDAEGLAWTTPIPGRGHSSPIVVGSRICLTAADENEHTQSLLIYDKRDGNLLVKKVVHRGKFPEEIHSTNTHASSTVACDGEHLFTLFLNDNAVWLTCFELTGEQRWQRRLAEFAPQEFKFGFGSSPILYDGSVIVSSEYDGPESCLVALDAATGEERWRTPRPLNLSFSTPAIARLKTGAQLLLSGNDIVAAYDPRNGNELWQVPATTQITCGTMIWDEELRIAFASGGYSDPQTVAVRLDGDHDVVWHNRTKCYESSMLSVDGFVYAVADNGIAFCWRGSDGKQMWKKRLKGQFSCSPLLIGGRIYLTNESGTTFIFRANGDEFDLVAENQLGTSCFATPAPVNGLLYHRFARGVGDMRQEFLAAIGPSE